jgi:hypothetical protein
MLSMVSCYEHGFNKRYTSEKLHLAASSDAISKAKLNVCNTSCSEGGRDGALALSDLRLLLNQPPRKLGGSYFFFYLMLIS